MKPRNWFFLVVFVGSLHLCSAKGNVLDPLIDKISIPARVSTAIAIQNGIYDEKKSNVIEVMAEHINTPYDYFNKFLQQDFDSSSVQLEEYENSVMNTPKIVLDNSNELVDALNLLLGMKQKENLLKPGGIVDPTDKFKQSDKIVVDASTDGTGLTDTESCTITFEGLRQILKTPADKINEDEGKKKLLELKQHMRHCRKELIEIQNYQANYKEYLGLVDLAPELKNIEHFVYIAGNFSLKFKSIDSFKTGLGSASTEAAKLKSAIIDQQKYSKHVESLSSSHLLSSADSHLKPSEKHITIGLRGGSDLKKIQSDLNDPWFKQNFVKNQSVQRLTIALKPLENFYSNFDGISDGWTKLSKDVNSKTTSLEIVKLVGKISNSGGNVLKLSSATSFEEVSTCLKPLQPIAKGIDHKEFKKITDFLGKLIERVGLIVNILNKIIGNSIDDTIEKLTRLHNSLMEIDKGSTNDTVSRIWISVRQQKFLEKLADALQSNVIDLESLPPNLFYIAGDKLNYDVIKNIAHSFNGTNVVEVIDCIKQSHIDHMLESFAYIALTNEFKSKSKEFGTTSALFKTSSEVQKSFKKLISDTKSTKLSKEALELKSFDGFKDIPKVAENIGGGVHSIRSINDISSKKKSIMVLVNANVPLKVEVSRIKGSDAVYNDETRKGLGATVADVEKFEKSIEKKPLNSISDVSTVVKEAMKIPGVQIQNSAIFKDIEKAISQNSNPEIKSTAADFGEVGSLDLDFARHNSRLKAYVPALPLFADLTQKFLMQGMKTQGSGGEVASRTREPTLWDTLIPIFVIIACVLVGLWIAFVALFIIGYVGFRRKQNRERRARDDIEAQIRKPSPSGTKKRKKSSTSTAITPSTTPNKTGATAGTPNVSASAAVAVTGKKNPDKKPKSSASTAISPGATPNKPGAIVGTRNVQRSPAAAVTGKKNPDKKPKIKMSAIIAPGSTPDTVMVKLPNMPRPPAAAVTATKNEDEKPEGLFKKISSWLCCCSKKKKMENKEDIESGLDDKPFEAIYVEMSKKKLRRIMKKEKKRRQYLVNEVGDGNEQNADEQNNAEVEEPPATTNRVLEIQKGIHKLREHVANTKAQEKIDYDPNRIKKMGPIYIPLEPKITPSAPIRDNIVLENVEYDPTGNEMYDIGSDVDDVEEDRSIGEETIMAMSESSTNLNAVPIEQNQPTTSGAPVQNQQDQPGPSDPPVQNQPDSSDQSTAPAPTQQGPPEEQRAPAPLQQSRPPTSPAPEQKSKKSKNLKKQPSGSSKKSDKKA